MNRLYNYSCAQYRQFSLECAPGMEEVTCDIGLFDGAKAHGPIIAAAQERSIQCFILD